MFCMFLLCFAMFYYVFAYCAASGMLQSAAVSAVRLRFIGLAPAPRLPRAMKIYEKLRNIEIMEMLEITENIAKHSKIVAKRSKTYMNIAVT